MGGLEEITAYAERGSGGVKDRIAITNIRVWSCMHSDGLNGMLW